MINIKFPLEDDNELNRLVSSTRVTKDSYSSNILLLLLTNQGERLYDPEYGTNLLTYIFEPNDSITAADVEANIRDTVSKYISGAKIVSVKFNWNTDADGLPISDNQLNVVVNFTYEGGDLNTITLNF